MRAHAAEALGAAAIALLMTLVIAAPVLRAPSERVFGADIVGRHHDPFTVMEQFSRPMSLGVYSQPVTDLTGAAIARATGPVAAYNWLVLLSFPLSAAAAYLLARHLALPPAGALLAALLFAFSPFHVAHAAYHPHIAQTQWIPLYLLALWRCMDRGSAGAVAFLVAATAAVTLSNFYGGLIAAVITPVAVGCAFAAARLRHGGALLVTLATLAVLAVVGLSFAWWTAPSVVADPSAFAFPREDLFRYSAKWWSYLVPPASHPLLGDFARGIWTDWNVKEGLLEHQVSLGWGVVALGLVAIYGWFTPEGRFARLAAVPILAVVALFALVCSLSPERTVSGITLTRPSALLYSIAPMFRAYARFGVVVQLMAALLAGIGASWLVARSTRTARIACTVLVALAISEYAVWPGALWRDVLPTAAHRWVMNQTQASRVLDCAPMDAESSSILWLTGGRITPRDGSFAGCADPALGIRLAGAGFTQVLVRDASERQWLRDHAAEEDLRLQAHFGDADVFALTASEPAP